MVKLNRLKKFLCSAVMAVVALTSVGAVMPAVEVSATDTISFMQGDVDGNGSVNLTDATLLSKFIYGRGRLNQSAITRCDVNEDYIIDFRDYNQIRKFNLHLATPVYKTNKTVYESFPEFEERTYYVHDCSQANTQYEDYTIDDPGEFITRSFSSPRRAPNINPNFIDDYENANTVDITIHNIGEPDSVGTGFIVGDNLVVTAAHCVFGEKNNVLKFYDDLDVTVYNENLTSSKTYNVSYMHIPEKYYNLILEGNYTKIQNESPYYDYALLYVEDNSIKDHFWYEPWNIGYITNEFYGTAGCLYSDGFCTPEGASSRSRYYCSGSILPEPKNDNKFYTHGGSLYGESGGPVYFKNIDGNSVNKTVVGILSGTGGNYDSICCRITPMISRFIYCNNNLTGVPKED